jgi:urease accessory protein
LGIFLPRGTTVRGGDVLVAEDGSLIKVIAAPQSVLKITHCSTHGTPYDLIRAAYHLGNRHVPIELKADHLKIEPDHVLTDMLRAMHLIVNAVDEAFEPESGAYAAGGHSHGGHGHSHGGHDHHDHAHDPAHTPAPVAPVAKPKLASIPIAAAPAAPHVHGPGCGHQH